MRMALGLLVAVALLGLASCGGGQTGRASGMSAAARMPVAVNPPAFGELHPVAWRGPGPAAFPVHGIDVARYQSAIDWPRAREAGVSFAFIKATEGGDRLDPMFERNWREAGAAGVPRGAYHFFYFCRPAEEQAAWFIRNVPRERGALPPVLDLEWNPHSPTCTFRPRPEVVRAEALRFLDILERHYGQRPIIYTDPGFFRENDLMQLAGEEVWLRSTARTPEEAYGVRGWTFWQYSGTGTVPGIAGPVDLNTFGGSEADWRAWLARRTI